jgi:hypothetical protein
MYLPDAGWKAGVLHTRNNKNRAKCLVWSDQNEERRCSCRYSEGRKAEDWDSIQACIAKPGRNRLSAVERPNSLVDQFHRYLEKRGLSGLLHKRGRWQATA